MEKEYFMNTLALAANSPEFKTETGLSISTKKDLAQKLGVVLADSYQLFIKTQGVHWNVSGPLFYSVHKLTEMHYQNLFSAIDVIAERIRGLGEKAPASYTKYGKLSSIVDHDKEALADEMVEMLAKDHEIVCQSLRAAIEFVEDKADYVTAGIMTDRLAWHEEAIWMLRATINE